MKEEQKLSLEEHHSPVHCHLSVA